MMMRLFATMYSQENNCAFNSLALIIALLAAGNLARVEPCRYQPDTTTTQCQTIHDDSICQHPHNSTSFPNIYNHLHQDAAEAYLVSHSLLKPLKLLNCSVYSQIFICSTVYPLCFEDLFRRVEPCREMCIAVRDSCAPQLLERMGQSWPDVLRCDTFSRYGTKLCIWNDTSSCISAISPVLPPVQGPSTIDGTGSTPALTHSSPTCTGHLTSVNNSQASFGGIKNCMEPCSGVYFEHDNNMLITVWTTAISVLSLVVSILVFLTYILNIKMIKNLEAPIYYIVLCYGCLAFTNLIPIAVGRDVAICDLGTQNLFNQSVLISDDWPVRCAPLCSAFRTFSRSALGAGGWCWPSSGHSAV